MGISAVITAFTFLIGVYVSGKALLTKSELEQVFLTHEQKIKMYYYRLFVLSGLVAVFIGDLFLLWELTIGGETAVTVNWNLVSTVSFVIFICCLFSLGTVEKLVQNLLINQHYKYKVILDDVGEVYILKMMNQDICICSKDPNAEFSREETENLLVKIENIIGKTLIKERHDKPFISIWRRLLD